MTFAQENKAAEIKYSPLRAAFKHLQHTFGDKLLSGFKTDPMLQAGQCATQVGVLMNHFRRMTKSRQRFLDYTGQLTQKQQEEFWSLYTFSTSDILQKPSSTPRKLKAALSNVSVDSQGFPTMLSSPKSPAESIALDPDGFPLTPDALKVKTASSKADEDALICSPPPVSKTLWHGGPLKRPAKAEEKADSKAKEKVIKSKKEESKPVLTKKSKSTGNFKINASTVVIGGGKGQSYLQHRPHPTASLQLIVSISSKMVSASTSHYDIATKLSPLSKKPGATKEDIVIARNKLIGKAC